MICAVYKTRKKAGMYLYLPKKDHFESVPEALMKQFGTPELVTLIALEKRESLAGVSKEKLIAALQDPGFYLQMPPKENDLLVEHRVSQGLSPRADKEIKL